MNSSSKQVPAAQTHYDQVDAAYDEDRDQEREIIRAGDAAEDELPPPSTTRNMLAKFQEIQEEAQREAANLKTPPPSKKVTSNSTVCIHFLTQAALKVADPGISLFCKGTFTLN